MSAFASGQRVHVVGVGGAGMSALAMLLAEMGAEVSGCDATDTPVLQDLRARHVTTFVGHDVRHVVDVDVVLWSPAVAPEHVELVRARENGAATVSRARALYELSLMKRIIGLAGTHGKTTATSMMVHVALAAGRDDGWLVGAPVLGVGANGRWGTGDLVVEVDESYGTFTELHPFALGLLNMEADHLDHYGTVEALETAFVNLVERTSGPVAAWSDDEGVTRVVRRSSRAPVLVGTVAGTTWRVTDQRLERRRATFRLRGPDTSLEITLRVTGAHNVANAALVAVLAHELGVSDDAVVRGLSNFVGAPRRYQYHGAWRGVDVYEDYAHLPGEIAATLAATHAVGYERVTVVFQPHRVTRTLALVDQFASAFEGARHVIVTGLYRAGEANPTAVTGEVIANAIRRHHPSLDTLYCDDLGLVGELLEQLVDDSDVLLVLGAGDVGSIINDLAGGLA
ncbi:MAG: UDP-N-acetylmuramate--L-alanine ligase [Acidimicrobiales bacterium]